MRRALWVSMFGWVSGVRMFTACGFAGGFCVGFANKLLESLSLGGFWLPRCRV